MGKRKRSGSFSKYDDGSKKSDDGDSQEELDGESVINQKANANGVRYSARVQEKQEKLRREASPSKQTVADSTSIATKVEPPNQIVAGEEMPESYSLENPFISISVGGSGEKKKKRTWELWSQEDKQLFFEALNEFGKDFDAIQNYLASKLKPKSKVSCNQTVAKNKDQVRHFYYRTWNKISKYLTFPKDMKKAYQELYGLINYGELRKKQRVLNLKTAVKLSELVDRGTTTIKVRGKTFRIKTPVCRALKKLNQLEDVDHIRVPCKLCVEIVPHDGDTWASIQRVSHNPRVKIFAPLQRTLASLILYLEERWKTDQNRLKEEFSLTMFGRPRTRLRLIPVENRDLSVPVFKYSEVTSATKISLNSFVQNRLHQDPQQDSSSLVSKKFKRKAKSIGDPDPDVPDRTNRDPDYLAAEADVSDADGCEAATDNQFKITLRRDKPHGVGGYNSPNISKPLDLFGDAENSNGCADNAFWSVHEENANAAAETDAGETDYGFDDNIPSPIECDDNTCDEDGLEPGAGDNAMPFALHDPDSKEEKFTPCAACRPSESDENHGTDKQERICSCGGKKTSENEPIKCDLLDAESVARGWNVEEAGTITLGQIYLVLGKADKLCFEYVWDKSQDDKLREDRAKSLIDKLINVARLQKKKKNNRAKTTANLTSVVNHAPILCAKCNDKIEPTPASDANLVTFHSDICEAPKAESPIRTAATTQPVGDPQEDPKMCVRMRTCLEPVKTHELIPKESPPLEPLSLESSAERQEMTLTVSSKIDKGSQIPEEPKSLANKVNVADSIKTHATEPSPHTSSLCSKTLGLPSQSTGLIEISTLGKNSVGEKERGKRANVQATILPAAPTLIRSVSVADVQKAAIGACHNTSMTTVCPTTVLVSEPAMFAGLTTNTSSFVTIQQCATTVSPSIPQNTQDNKFRRPADIPILMKPASDDRSTNEDNSTKVTVPKPFLDLPKGNRRIGRRPAWKQRVIIPRMLPLLPKLDATMTTLIAIPPVPVGISVVPVSTENITSVTTLPVSITAETDIPKVSAAIVTPTAPSSSSEVTIAVSSGLPPSTPSNMSVTSSNLLGSSMSVPGATATALSKKTDLPGMLTNVDKVSPFKAAQDTVNQTASSSRAGGFEESLDNLSLSSFMDISIPESTRFIASDLRLEELECSNSSMSLGGMLDESSRKNTRDPPLLETPKKGTGSDDSALQIPSPSSPQRIAPLETSWPAMNEVSDLFMGGLFSGNETLRSTPPEPMSEGDLNFQSVIGENSLDFDTKLNNFASNARSTTKD